MATRPEEDVASCIRRVFIRLTEDEDSIVDQACDALAGLEKSQLVQEAVLVEASRLGIRWSVERPPRLTKPWPYMPVRTEGTGHRVCVSVSVALAELARRAADHVGASEPNFMLGATLAYIGRLQRLFEGSAAETPAEGVKMRASLQDIQLPPQYQYRGRRVK